MLKKIAITSYYMILAMLITTQAVKTVYQLSSTIGFGQKVSLLENRKRILLTEKQLLEEKITKEISLYEIQSLVDNDKYSSIKKPIIVSINKNVAIRQP